MLGLDFPLVCERISMADVLRLLDFVPSRRRGAQIELRAAARGIRRYAAAVGLCQQCGVVAKNNSVRGGRKFHPAASP
jgi:hypothetical protein